MFGTDISTAFINFGAFPAFFAVNACVVRYLTKYAGEWNARTIVLIVAIALLFFSRDKPTIELLSWLAVCVGYVLAETRVLRRPLPTMSTEV